jgi:hypothetical protein
LWCKPLEIWTFVRPAMPVGESVLKELCPHRLGARLS